MTGISYRTRFAPSPSGTLHIGNLRSALMSFLCAKETNGTFILRIEDTDQTRTDEKFLLQIYHFLEVMGLDPDEGPLQSGPHAPYIQSTRQLIYQKYLALFESKNLIYRCFQSEEELETQRKKQIELKLPPRYTRKIISQEEEAELINQNRPFVWRLALPKKQVTIFDKVKQHLTFDLAHFADIPLTRHDGTFTFLFANFVDDVEMKINYVVRGEEHLSNTAIQAYMYEAIGISLPFFYHLPLICDSHGKKLSKRDFGFNIQDLLNAGFLPEAILNYLIIIGGSFKEEIFSLDEAIAKKVFSENKSAGMITYDQKKLLWINKKWMQKISKEKFIQYLNLHEDKLVRNTGFVLALKNEAATLKEIRDAILAIEDMHSAIRIDFDAVIFSFFTDTLIPFLEKEEGEFFEWKKVKKVVDEFAIKNNLLAIKVYKLIRYICIQKEEGISLSLLFKHIPSAKIIIKLKKIMESI